MIETFKDLCEELDLHPRCASGVGPGWFPILRNLVTELRASGWDGKIGQIKEKFGSLRFYPDSPADDDVIVKYEALSRKTCEYCGYF